MYTTSSSLHLTTRHYFSMAESNKNLLLVINLKGFTIQIFQNFEFSGVCLHLNFRIAATPKMTIINFNEAYESL